MKRQDTKWIVLGADHAGYRLKERIRQHLEKQGYQVEDVGCYSEESVDYPSIGRALAEKIKKANDGGLDGSAKGILCCGSGVGVCMIANRFPWVRAVVGHDHNTAVMSRRHNDANVLCQGGRIIAPELACDIIDTWLATDFDGGRHQNRVDMMSRIVYESQENSEGAPLC